MDQPVPALEFKLRPNVKFTDGETSTQPKSRSGSTTAGPPITSRTTTWARRSPNARAAGRMTSNCSVMRARSPRVLTFGEGLVGYGTTAADLRTPPTTKYGRCWPPTQVSPLAWWGFGVR